MTTNDYNRKAVKMKQLQLEIDIQTKYDLMCYAVDRCHSLTMNKEADLYEQLIAYEAMCQTIADCHANDDGENITSPSKALRYYARIAKNLTLEKQIVEIRLSNDRKAKKGFR